MGFVIWTLHLVGRYGRHWHTGKAGREGRVSSRSHFWIASLLFFPLFFPAGRSSLGVCHLPMVTLHYAGQLGTWVRVQEELRGGTQGDRVTRAALGEQAEGPPAGSSNMLMLVI